MSTETGLDTLKQDVRYLMDRTAILDCIVGHARGCDRHDIDLITAAYHPDAVDEHGLTKNPGPDYGEWANKTHAATSQVHTHNITTHSCDIDGDIAHADSYAIVVLLGADGKTAQFVSGRYIDRLERRDGHWRIALRRSTVETMFLADAACYRPHSSKNRIPLRDQGPSRSVVPTPLDLDTPAPQLW